MKNHFFFPYTGNKRSEVENIYSKINFEGIDTIVEPFCGSCALSFYIWQQWRDTPKKFKFILNDTDKNLIELIKMVKSKNKKKIQAVEKELNDMIRDENDEVTITKEKYKEHLTKGLAGYILGHKHTSIRPGLFPLKQYNTFNKIFKFSDYPIFEFLQKADIKILNKDGCDVIEEYNKPNCFIFLDPPYIACCNDFYSERKLNMYQYITKIGFDKFEAKMLICHEKNWLFDIIFKDFIKEGEEYGKTYQVRKVKTQHICIMNY